MRKLLSFLKSEIGRIVIGAVFFSFAVITDLLFDGKPSDITVPILYVIALLAAGASVFIDAVRGILRRDLLDEKFLMSIASVGAMILGEFSEGVAVMLFFLVGEYFEHKAVAKSRKSIRSLMDIRPDEATLIIDGREETVDADDVEVGSVIIIKAGERVALDCEVVSGNADVDTSSLTGEAIPRAVSIGSRLDAATVVMNGVLVAKTLRVADESSAARVLSLVEDANERKSRTESFITRFSHFYTPIVVILAVLLAIIPPIFKLTLWTESVYRALIFLVISCPCALVISVPMAFFGGIGGAAADGILFKGGNTFSALAAADSFVFDKTGTLTDGKFEVSDVNPIGVSREELLYYAASAESGSNHPIAVCISAAAEKKGALESVTELSGRGVFAVVDGQNILVGNRTLMQEYSIPVSENTVLDKSVIVAKNGAVIGTVTLSDKIKKEAKSAIESLRKNGVKRCTMLSGDRAENALRVASQLNIDEVHAELLPDNKYQKLEEIINSSKKTVFVGDGINDAPSIALADVGVAMGAIGADSAIEAADVVIMSDDLSRLPRAKRIAAKTCRIAIENIIFALGVKGAVMVLGALGLANMWLAVFADVGVAALAILNSMRTLGRR